MILELTIPVCPVAKERARVTRFGTYTPARTKEFERQVMMHIRRHAPEKPFGMPLKVEIEFHLPKPRRAKFKVHAVRPDCDNFLKAVMDAGNGILWKDDALIWDLRGIKVYALNEPKILLKIQAESTL